jgi:outer membrane protein
MAMGRTRLTWWIGVPAVCLVATATAGSAQAQEQESAPRTMTVEACVGEALRRNPDSLSSDYDVKAAEAGREGARGAFAPRVHADAAFQEWFTPFSIQFGPSQFRVRDPFTWTASASLIQPITNLLSIYDQYKVADYGVDVAAIGREATRRDVAYSVVEAYYRVLEAQRLSEVAATSVDQLGAQLKQAQSLLDNGVIGKNDLLRASLALASAKQRAIQARGQTTIARARLATLMGLAADAEVEPVAFKGDPPAPSDVSVQVAESRAVAQRPEIRQLARVIDQADAQVGVANKKLLPNVNVTGNYTHFDGSAFQQADAAYVGLFASWDVWDWGTTTSGIHEADARLEQARLARKKLEEQVKLDARQAFVGASTASEALTVARAAVSQAEENYRIVSKKFEAAAATSFDVVDAESLLTQARGQVETALYDYLIARAALARAMGEAMPGER